MFRVIRPNLDLWIAGRRPFWGPPDRLATGQHACQPWVLAPVLSAQLPERLSELPFTMASPRMAAEPVVGGVAGRRSAPAWDEPHRVRRRPAYLSGTGSGSVAFRRQ